MKKRAFTLIELLTVIAVIAVLTAILIPAVSGVRERAKQAQSVSNIRELYTANMAYANENNGFASATDWRPDGTKTWHERIGSYVGLGETTEQVLLQFRAEERPPGIFAVPGRTRLLTSNGGDGGGFRSGYTRSLKIYANDGELLKGGSKRNLLSYSSVAQTYFLIDAGGVSPEMDFNGWQINPDAIAQWPAHGGSDGQIVVCFMDGHTESIAKADIPADWQDVFWVPRR